MGLRNMVAPGAGCPIRNVLDRVSDRWSLLILRALDGQTLRFTVLKREIGDISQRMLAQTLRRLEQDGYVSRKVTGEHPAARRLFADAARPLIPPMCHAGDRLGARQPEGGPGGADGLCSAARERGAVARRGEKYPLTLLPRCTS